MKITDTIARWVIQKYKPGIIAVTGATGKTSAVEMIYTILRGARRINTTILDPKHPFVSGLNALITTNKYPELLALEYRADGPRTINRFIDIARPQISVVTVAHYDARYNHEYQKIISALPSNGYGILNNDDPAVCAMKEQTRAHLITFGFTEGADVRIVGFEYRTEILEGIYRPLGISFKLEFGGAFVPVRLDGTFGKPSAYAAAAAACVGIAFGFNLIRISEALQYYQSLPHRMRLLPSMKGTYILDDTYDATVWSTRAALEALKNIPAKRTVGILGDLDAQKEQSFTISNDIGQCASKACDVLITIGAGGRLIASGASKAGFDKNKIFGFDNLEQAQGPIKELIQRGDLILIKGSGALHLERLVAELSSHRLVV